MPILRQAKRRFQCSSPSLHDLFNKKDDEITKTVMTHKLDAVKRRYLMKNKYFTTIQGIKEVRESKQIANKDDLGR